MPRDVQRSKRREAGSNLAEKTNFNAEVEIAPSAIAGHNRQAKLHRKREASAIAKRYTCGAWSWPRSPRPHGTLATEDLNGQIEGPDDILNVLARVEPRSANQPTISQ